MVLWADDAHGCKKVKTFLVELSVMKSGGGIAGKEKIVSEQEFIHHCWDKCTATLTNMDSDWM